MTPGARGALAVAALAAAACSGDPFTADYGLRALDAADAAAVPSAATDVRRFPAAADAGPHAEGAADTAPSEPSAAEAAPSPDGASAPPAAVADAGPADLADSGAPEPPERDATGGGGNTCWLRNTLDCVAQGATGYQCQTTAYTLELAGLACELWDAREGVYCCRRD